MVINSLEAAIEHARSIAKADKQTEIMIIGGSKIYQQTMKLADRLYISHVDIAPKGDSLFPLITKSDWLMVKEIATEKSPRDSNDYKLLYYERISA